MLIGFDADDTLWHSEIYFQAAHAEFERILGAYVDLHDARVHDALLSTERRNIRLFGYGAKGMTLSLLETALAITGHALSGLDVQRLLDLGKAILAHPVELLPGIEQAVTEVAADYPLVLITKGDLFHQEAKIRQCALREHFSRIEIVSEKDPETYQRLLAEFGVGAEQFLMVGNSLKSDIEPVARLGGYGVHVPYVVTWALEAEHALEAGHPRVATVKSAHGIPGAIARLLEST